MLQVMVAEPRSRGKGLAFEALVLFMVYAIEELVSISSYKPSHGVVGFTQLKLQLLIATPFGSKASFSLQVQSDCNHHC